MQILRKAVVFIAFIALHKRPIMTKGNIKLILARKKKITVTKIMLWDIISVVVNLEETIFVNIIGLG